MRLYQFGSVLLVEDEAVDAFNMPAKSGLVPLRNGAYDQLGNTYYGDIRQFTRTFVVVDTDGATIQEQVDDLLREFGRGRLILKAVTRDGDYRQTWAKATDVPMKFAPGDLGMQQVTAAFEVDYPYWLKSLDEPYYLDHGHSLDDGWSLDGGQVETESVTTTNHSFTITNNGTAPVARGQVTILPGVGASLTTLRLRNTTTGHSIKWDGTLASGDRLDIDFLTKTVRLNGATAYADVTVDNTMDWMVLNLGDNAIDVLSSSITGTVTVYWRWATHYR